MIFKLNFISIILLTGLLCSLQAVVLEEHYSLKKVIDIALKNNLDLKISNETLTKSKNSLIMANAIFDPAVQLSYTKSATYMTGQTYSTANSIPYTSAASVSTKNKATQDDYALGFGGKTIIGATYGLQLGLTGSKGTMEDASGNGLAITSSSYSSKFGFTLAMPLLRGGWFAQNMLPLYSAKIGLSGADFNNKQTISNQIAAVSIKFLDLNAAYNTLEIKKRAFDRAKKTLKDTELLIQNGRLAKIDELNAKISLTSKENDLLNAQIQIDNLSEDLMELLNFDKKERIIPTPLEKQLVQVDTSFNSNWEHINKFGPAVNQAKLSLENARNSYDAAKNGSLPDISFNSTYGYQGDSTGGYKDAFKNTFDSDKKSGWSAGLVFSMPIGNRIPYYQKTNSLKDLKIAEINNTKAIDSTKTNLRKILQNIETSKKQIELAKLSNENSKIRLDAAEERFRVGKLSSDKLLDCQDEFYNSEVNLQTAFDGYRKILISLAQLRGEVTYLNETK